MASAKHGDHVEQVKEFIRSEASEEAIENNLTAAETVLEYLPDPTDLEAEATGLILGRIQAGKTMAILSTIAMAADNGYRVFVVLTSDNTWLHKQTKDRLSQALPGLYFPDEDSLDSLPIEEIEERGLVFVCTKNAENLRGLLEVLTNADLGVQPALLVDDEADQASLDTKARILSAPPSTINALITELRSLFSVSAFLQVTATPNALLLQPSGHDYRPEFVVVLEPGSAYVGGAILFDEDRTFVRDVDLQELLDFLSMRAGTPNGLKLAVATFLTAATMKRMLGSAGKFFFLCHVSHLKDRHELIRQAVDQYLNDVTAALTDPDGHPDEVNLLDKAYRDLAGRITAPPPFEVVLKRLRRDIPSRDIQVLNADADVSEPRDNRIYNFLIGGNRLGRGVTIKRLLVTYYGRSVKKPQMDTMQQHARMYGYRRQELDAIRIFVPRDMAAQFQFLDESDTALRSLVMTGRFEGIEPIFANQNMRVTRTNVLAGDLGYYVAGQVYSPQYPKYLAKDISATTKDLDRILARFNPTDDTRAAAESIPTTDLIEIVSLCRSYSGMGGQWEDERVSAALETLRERFPVSWIVVRRDRNLNKPKDRLRDPSTPQDRPLRHKERPTLWMYRQNGSGWDGVPFWIPRIQFPDGRYAIAFNLTDD